MHFTMEHEDFELPSKIDGLLKGLIGSSEIDPHDKALHQVAKLIDMYRNFFGSGSSGQKVDDANLRIMTQTLVDLNELAA